MHTVIFKFYFLFALVTLVVLGPKVPRHSDVVLVWYCVRSFLVTIDPSSIGNSFIVFVLLTLLECGVF